MDKFEHYNDQIALFRSLVKITGRRNELKDELKCSGDCIACGSEYIPASSDPKYADAVKLPSKVPCSRLTLLFISKLDGYILDNINFNEGQTDSQCECGHPIKYEYIVKHNDTKEDKTAIAVIGSVCISHIINNASAHSIDESNCEFVNCISYVSSFILENGPKKFHWTDPDCTNQKVRKFFDVENCKDKVVTRYKTRDTKLVDARPTFFKILSSSDMESWINELSKPRTSPALKRLNAALENETTTSTIKKHLEMLMKFITVIKKRTFSEAYKHLNKKEKGQRGRPKCTDENLLQEVENYTNMLNLGYVCRRSNKSCTCEYCVLWQRYRLNDQPTRKKIVAMSYYKKKC